MIQKSRKLNVQTEDRLIETGKAGRGKRQKKNGGKKEHKCVKEENSYWNRMKSKRKKKVAYLKMR